MKNISVISSTEEQVLSWTAGIEGVLPTFPDFNMSSCLLGFLNDDNIVQMQCVRNFKNADDLVVILHQNNIQEKPEVIWAAFQFYLKSALKSRHRIWIVLSGGADFLRQRAWNNWLNFIPENKLSMWRLELHILSSSIFRCNGFLTRNLRRVARLMVKKRK
ncbi:hypothetical protein [Scandinavium goeteborgense]|uniref:hypothetical protein n=1 Tax=Scandinavium goeteborgense TaxID=1851514 RepID=UPI000F6809D2|nr:hypothetical protein [Scandinavium goeteborgense]QKN79782.1 hypothetical protein A8O29_000145 [Scandinavium goeteborgense]